MAFSPLFPNWRSAQASALKATCRASENEVMGRRLRRSPGGFVAIGFVDEDAARAGEVHMIAVDPVYRATGVGLPQTGAPPAPAPGPCQTAAPW